MGDVIPEWRRVGENLVQHRGGTIYLRAKIPGKKGPVKLSLETPDLRIAKIARDARLEKLRAAAAQVAAGAQVPRTLGDLVSVVEARVTGQRHHKATTGKYNGELIGVLRETLPLELAPKRWTEVDAREWWSAIGRRFGTTRGNALLHLCRRVMKLAVTEGLLRADPTAEITLMKEKKKLRVMPTWPELERVIADIAIPRKKTSAEAGLFVEFLAASGVRPEEARAMLLTDVRGRWLAIRGNESGTKNGSERLLPISPRLQEILARIRALKNGTRLFSIQDPRASLRAACVRQGVAHLTLYDMRHYFATWAIESGVDIPTVAKWIGHKDGGALLMRTYTHIRDQHGLAKAALLK